jgi:phosphate-selective porin OprO/OprP
MAAMSINRLLHAAILAVLALPFAGQAEEVSNEELQQRLEEQDQKIKVLERKLELGDESAAAAKESSSVVSAGTKGVSIKSADGKNEFRLRATLHLDGRYLEGDDPADPVDTFQATRVRPIFEGTLAGIYEFRFVPDFGQGRTVIQDAYVAGHFNPAFELRLGKYKSPVGLERLQSSNDLRMIQRGFPTSLVPNRDIGLQAGGDVAEGRISYALAWMNGANDGSSSDSLGDVDVNDDKEYVMRLFAQPFAQSENAALRGLGFGIAGSFTDQTGSATQTLLPSYRTPGQSTFFRYRAASATASATIADGERVRFAPQAYYYAGRLGVIAEYTEVSQEMSRVVPTGLRQGTVDTDAWQIQAAWFLTGEEQAYRGFKPIRRFSLQDGTWGAFELVARVQAQSASDAAFAGGEDSFADPLASAQKADAWGVGFNWYLNENVKWLLNYDHTAFEGGAADGDREDEDAFQLRLAVGF